MTLQERLSTIRDCFALAKDLFLGLLIGALLIWPSALANRLQRAGFSHGDFGVLTWDPTQTAQNVSQAKQGVQDVTGALEQVTADPKYARDERLRQILTTLKSSEADITSADSAMKTPVAQQTSAQTNSKNLPAQGWIMLGRVDEARQHWVTTNLSVATGSAYTVAASQELQLATAAYLRSGSIAGQRTTGSIVNVVAAGTKIKILQLDTQSHALAGGWFVWANVTIEGASS